uniref:Ubiquitin carboxyl-terminal hydrolase 37 n=1 Tax=Magallana gigas TaxID=29159 RepID=K1QE91_MAGGI
MRNACTFDVYSPFCARPNGHTIVSDKTMARLEIIGELKYSGLESGTTNWKQGTMVLHSKDGCWKLDLHINCNRRGPVQSFQINSNTIKKILLKEKIYFIELFMHTKGGGACNIYFKPDTRSLAKTREFDAVMQDIKKNKIEQSQTPCKDKSTVSRTGLLGDSPMSTNVKTFSRDTPSKQFTSMKEPPRKEGQPSLYCDEEFKENVGSDKENFLYRGLEKSNAVTKQSGSVDSFPTPKFYMSSKHSPFSGHSLSSVGTASASKRLELMPDPTPRLSTGVNYSWSKNKLSLPQKENNQLSGSLVRLHGSRKRIVSDIAKRDLLRSVKQAISSSAKRFSGYQQHDAHEFLSQVLDQLKEEVAKVMKSTPSPSRSPREVTEGMEVVNPTLQNFEFEVTHTISCSNCPEEVTKAEQFYDLSLEMPRRRAGSTPCTIQHALDLFFRKESIEYKCEKCGCCKAEVSHKFTKLPRVLILHLKRYNYNSGSSVQSKMLQNIVIPKFLSLSTHCNEETSKPYPIHAPLPLPSFRFKKSRVLPLFESDDDLSISSSPSKKPKLDEGQDKSETTEKEREPFKTLTLADTQEDPDLAKALELSLQEANERAQQQQYTDEVDGGHEDSDFQKALEMSRMESENPQSDHDYGSSLNGMSEEEQMRIAIEESMRDFAQANYLPDPEEEEEERYYTEASGSRITEQTQHNKGGDLIKQCSAIVYESCLQNGLENGDPLEKATGENTAEDFVACRSKYFTKQEKCSVCDKTKDKDVSMDGECKCVTDATDCNGNEVGSGKSLVQLNGGSSQQDGFVPKLSSENDFKSMFDDDDFDKDVMLLDEPWASDDKENKKPSEPSEEDTCLIEDLPVVCNEKGELPQSYRLVSVVNHIGASSFVESEIRSSRERSGYIFFYLNKDIYEDLAEHFEKHNTPIELK